MPNIYKYSECDEIADNMSVTKRLSFDDALKIIKAQMPDETVTIIDNTAESLMLKSWRKFPKQK